MSKVQLYPVNDVLFVARGDGVLLKIRGTAGGGQNMFAICEEGEAIVGVPGYDYWLGTQRFNASLAGLVYADGVTVIGLTDGRMLKVVGQGGTGQNMFAVTESPAGFASVPGYQYLVGSQRFSAPVEGVWNNSNALFVSSLTGSGSNLVKIHGTGGSGGNMLAIREVGNTITGETGYDYWLGTQQLSGVVTGLLYANGATVIGLSDGRMLKVREQGGGGQNMFAIKESETGFEGIPGYDYLMGSQRFTLMVDGLWQFEDVLFVALAEYDSIENVYLSSTLLKLRGTGGRGDNMLAVREEGGTITGEPGYEYWLGTQQFEDRVTGLSYADGVTIVSLGDGRMLKVRGLGGTGQNMFAVMETGTGFASVPGYDYLLGSQRFRSGVDGLWQINDVLFVALDDGTLLKVRGTGGTGENMLAVREEGGTITGELGYDYWLGTQQLRNLSPTRTEAILETAHA